MTCTLTPVQQLDRILEEGVFEGMPFKLLDRPVQKGDTYLAARSTGPHLLTAKDVVLPKTHPGRIAYYYVVPVEMAYSFDLGECFAIEFQS